MVALARMGCDFHAPEEGVHLLGFETAASADTAVACHGRGYVSQLVHELQRERGRSAGFVGSGGDAKSAFVCSFLRTAPFHSTKKTRTSSSAGRSGTRWAIGISGGGLSGERRFSSSCSRSAIDG